MKKITQPLAGARLIGLGLFGLTFLSSAALAQKAELEPDARAERRQTLVERFDTNQDGQFDEQERSAMRAARKARMAEEQSPSARRRGEARQGRAQQGFSGRERMRGQQQGLRNRQQGRAKGRQGEFRGRRNQDTSELGARRFQREGAQKGRLQARERMGRAGEERRGQRMRGQEQGAQRFRAQAERAGKRARAEYPRRGQERSRPHRFERTSRQNMRGVERFDSRRRAKRAEFRGQDSLQGPRQGLRTRRSAMKKRLGAHAGPEVDVQEVRQSRRAKLRKRAQRARQ